jgi:hypothetical protein
MTEYEEDGVTSWAELADELEYAFPKIAARIRGLIPVLGDPNGPPRAGEIISGDRLDKCVVGTLLRGDKAGVAAIRTVNGWSVTGMTAEMARGFIPIKGNFWKVVDVPARGQRVS